MQSYDYNLKSGVAMSFDNLKSVEVHKQNKRSSSGSYGGNLL